jgi:hypothetical protein
MPPTRRVSAACACRTLCAAHRGSGLGALYFFRSCGVRARRAWGTPAQRDINAEVWNARVSILAHMSRHTLATSKHRAAVPSLAGALWSLRYVRAGQLASRMQPSIRVGVAVG